MICAVTTFASSFSNYLYEKAVYDNGKWHASIRNTSYSVYEDVWCTGDISEAIYMQQIGYAKIENYSCDVRMDEGAVYAKLTLSFTEDIPKDPDPHELIGEVYLQI
jgi:hypothetical protein